MGEYQSTTAVSAPPDRLFDYLSEVGNLPKYMKRMKSAERSGDEAVRTVAEAPGGKTVEGEAWFKVKQDQNRIEWGSEGESNYNGWLEVRPAGGGSEVEVFISTQRVESDVVQKDVEETTGEIKRLVEGS